MVSLHELDRDDINLWIDENEAVTQWDTNGKFTLLLVEHGSLFLNIDSTPLLVAAPCLLSINQRSRVEFLNSTLLKVSRIVFEPVFINVNLKLEKLYLRERQQMFRDHHIDKLELFTDNGGPAYSLLPLSETVYRRMTELFERVRDKLYDRYSPQWRCCIRDPLLAILSLAKTVREELSGPPTFLTTVRISKNYVPIVTEYLHSNYEQKVTVSELCALVGVNRNELSREFKSHTGKTIVTYLLDCRLAHAVDALLLTERTLLAIAQDCGFNSETYFIRMFTRKFGMTPTEYRKFYVDKRKRFFAENS